MSAAEGRTEVRIAGPHFRVDPTRTATGRAHWPTLRLTVLVLLHGCPALGGGGEKCDGVISSLPLVGYSRGRPPRITHNNERLCRWSAILALDRRVHLPIASPHSATA